MPTTEKLTWIRTAPEPGSMYLAECGVYVFEISKAPGDATYALELWQQRSKDRPLQVWGLDGFTLDDAKAKAERLAAERVPDLVRGGRSL